MELFLFFAFWAAIPLGMLGLAVAWWNRHQTVHLIALIVCILYVWMMPQELPSVWHHTLFGALITYIWYVFGLISLWALRKLPNRT